MSKIICDVCGTSYPETAVQCPICGCVRPGEVKVVTGDTTQPVEEKASNSYTHVKGGRFSKSNVRKRNSGHVVAEEQVVPPVSDSDNTGSEDQKDNGKKKGDIGLTITVIVLLLAIVAVVLYIILRFFAPALTDKNSGGETNNPQISTTTEQTSSVQDTTENTTIDATEDSYSTEFHVDELVTLMQQNETFQLSVVGVEDDSIVTFTSDDESIATVSDNGVITAVSAGETSITAMFDDKLTVCKVVCDFSGESTDPTGDETEPSEEETTVPAEIDPNATYTISHKEVTLLTGDAGRRSFELTLKDADGNVVDVVWQDDNGLCKIDGNTITAESTGSTYVYTVVNGVKYSCRVIIWYDV